MQCKNCGANLQEGASFCMNCGKSCDQGTLVQPEFLTQEVIPSQQVNPTMQNGIQPMNNQNNRPNNKKMYLIIAGIILVAAIAIAVVLWIDKKEVPATPSTDTNSSSNQNSGLNTNTNTNTNTNSNSNFNDEKVSGAEVEFNDYKFMIPSTFEAEVDHWEYLGDDMELVNKANNNEFVVELEKVSYSDIKNKSEEIKEELSNDGFYTMGEIQYKTYNGKEYMVVSSKYNTIYRMHAYVSLSDSETLVIEAEREDYGEDYEIFSEIAPIIASAHK